MTTSKLLQASVLEFGITNCVVLPNGKSEGDTKFFVMFTANEVLARRMPVDDIIGDDTGKMHTQRDVLVVDKNKKDEKPLALADGKEKDEVGRKSGAGAKAKAQPQAKGKAA